MLTAECWGPLADTAAARKVFSENKKAVSSSHHLTLPLAPSPDVTLAGDVEGDSLKVCSVSSG